MTTDEQIIAIEAQREQVLRAYNTASTVLHAVWSPLDEEIRKINCMIDGFNKTHGCNVPRIARDEPEIPSIPYLMRALSEGAAARHAAKIEEATAFCSCCDKEFPMSDLNYGPDPYMNEIYNDDTPCYLCEECHQTRRDDI